MGEGYLYPKDYTPPELPPPELPPPLLPSVTPALPPLNGYIYVQNQTATPLQLPHLPDDCRVNATSSLTRTASEYYDDVNNSSTASPSPSQFNDGSSDAASVSMTTCFLDLGNSLNGMTTPSTSVPDNANETTTTSSQTCRHSSSRLIATTS